jgi:flagellar biosynthesis protein FlhB
MVTSGVVHHRIIIIIIIIVVVKASDMHADKWQFMHDCRLKMFKE